MGQDLWLTVSSEAKNDAQTLFSMFGLDDA